MAMKYREEDVRRSFKWLGHAAYTEMNAFHPEYRPGAENRDWNREGNTYPRIRYAKSERDVVGFVKQYSNTRTVCYGLNSRSRVFRNDQGYSRAALNSEIETSQNLLFDFDLNTVPVDNHATEFDRFLKRTNDYFRDLGLQIPVWASTGRGYHLLFSFSPIQVARTPDIAARLRQFRDQFRDAHRKDLDALEARLDNTQDLRRMARVYGTAKPAVGVISEFHGEQRNEDQNLRDYLLAIRMNRHAAYPRTDRPELDPDRELPKWFDRLLTDDVMVRNLWSGIGKPATTDKSRSGFDYSLTRRLLQLGHRDIDDLAAILALRPEGAAREKGEHYIRRTIANALTR